MTRLESKTTLPSLHKYMRRRRILSKSGFYLEIKGNGEVSCTRDESSIYGSLLILSVGPNFVAIIGEHAKRYLAIDEQGKVFTTMSERKECVFREFLGRNFFSLFRTCHSDSKGRGWYLSISDVGKIRAEKVSYSDEPQLHFLVKVVKEKHQEKAAKKPKKQIDYEPVWKRRSSESLSQSCSSSSPVSESGRSEYGSPVAFSHHCGLTSPVSVSGRSEYGSPVAFSHHPGLTSPVSVSGRSEYGSPVAFSHHSGLTSPVSVSGRSEYGSPVAFSHHSGHSSLVSSSSRSGQASQGSLSSRSGSSFSSKGSVRSKKP